MCRVCSGARGGGATATVLASNRQHGRPRANLDDSERTRFFIAKPQTSAPTMPDWSTSSQMRNERYAQHSIAFTWRARDGGGDDDATVSRSCEGGAVPPQPRR